MFTNDVASSSTWTYVDVLEKSARLSVSRLDVLHMEMCSFGHCND